MLQNHDHVDMASRHGRLPAVRNRLRLTPPKYLTEERQKQTLKARCSLKILKREIEHELRLVYNKKIELDQLTVSPNAMEQLKEDLELAESRQNIWEDSVMNFVNYIAKAWPYLSLRDKKHFYQKEIYLVQRYISAFPYKNAQLIYKFLQSGRLSIRKGIKHLEQNDLGFRALFLENNREYTVTYDYVINATAVDCNVRRSKESIYKNLSKKGIILENAFGGIKVGKEFQIKSSRVYEDIFYAAGPMTSGTIPFTNLLLSSAETAEIIAIDLGRKIAERLESPDISKRKSA